MTTFYTLEEIRAHKAKKQQQIKAARAAETARIAEEYADRRDADLRVAAAARQAELAWQAACEEDGAAINRRNNAAILAGWENAPQHTQTFYDEKTQRGRVVVYECNTFSDDQRSLSESGWVQWEDMFVPFGSYEEVTEFLEFVEVEKCDAKYDVRGVDGSTSIGTTEAKCGFWIFGKTIKTTHVVDLMPEWAWIKDGRKLMYTYHRNALDTFDTVREITRIEWSGADNWGQWPDTHGQCTYRHFTYNDKWEDEFIAMGESIPNRGALLSETYATEPEQVPHMVERAGTAVFVKGTAKAHTPKKRYAIAR